MKKSLFGILAAATMLFTSCSQDDMGLLAPGEKATVTISLDYPTINSRAFSEGKLATHLKWAVYDLTEGTPVILPELKGEDTQYTGKKAISMDLASGRSYGFVFWAGNDAAPYTVTFGESSAQLSVDYSEIQANKDENDAFYTYITHTVTGAENISAKLRRPFTQINYGTSDMTASKNAGYEPAETQVEVTDVYSQLDLMSGEVSGEPQTVTFKYNALPTGETYPEVKTGLAYDYLAMAYVLAPIDQALVDVTLYHKNSAGKEYKLTTGSVPVKRNFRTNLFGALLTDELSIEVETQPDFDGNNDIPLSAKNVADGVVFDAASPENNNTPTFYLLSEKGLVWLSEAWQGLHESDLAELNTLSRAAAKTITSTFSGTTIILASDVDMSEVKNWIPIGNQVKYDQFTTSKIFAGNFDGANHTIRNLTVDRTGKPYAGLFGAVNGTIKNLKMENVNLKATMYAGAITGSSYNSRTDGSIDNCHIKNVNIVLAANPTTNEDGNDAAGIVGMMEQIGSVTNCSVTDAYISGCRDIAGVAGKIRVDGATVNNCRLTNVTVIAQYNADYQEKDKVEDAARGGKTYNMIAGCVMSGAKTPTTNLDAVNSDNNFVDNVTVSFYPDADLITVGGQKCKTLNEAMLAAANGGTVELGIGNYDIKSITSMPKNAEIKIVGKDVSLTKLSNVSNNHVLENCDLVLSNLTLEVEKLGTGTSMGFKNVKTATFEKVDIYGEYHSWDGEYTFNNCNFNYAGGVSSNNERNLIFTEGATKITFNKCNFSNIISSKAILVYASPAVDVMGDIEVNDCTFSGPAKYNKKAAVEIHSEQFKKAGTISIKNAKFNQDEFLGLWREINNNDGTPTNFYKIIVDGDVKQPGGQTK